MKRKLCGVLCGCMVVGLLAGCGSSTTSTTGEATGDNGTETAAVADTTADAGDGTEIKIWHDGNEAVMTTIQDYVNEQLKDDGISVAFEKKTGLTDQLQLYGNDPENGPDMYFYAHDSLGMLAQMGILAPISDVTDVDTLDADLDEMTVEASTYQDTQYMVPMYFETLLFMYNKDLWQGDVPSTTDELYDYMVENTDTDAGTYAVLNQHSTAYNVAPFINGYGGFIIDKDGNPGLTDQNTLDAIKYNQKFAALQADGDYNTVTTLFTEGKAQAIIAGPWLVSSIQEAGINLGIKSLSNMTLPNGEALAPYSGVQGAGVMKYAATEKKDAIAKVLEVMAGSEMGEKLAIDDSCAPANVKAYDNADVTANEMILAIKETAKTAQPMPNIPEMSVMWGPTEEFLAAVNKSGADVDSSAESYQDAAKTAIADMQ